MLLSHYWNSAAKHNIHDATMAVGVPGSREGEERTGHRIVTEVDRPSECSKQHLNSLCQRKEKANSANAEYDVFPGRWCWLQMQMQTQIQIQLLIGLTWCMIISQPKWCGFYPANTYIKEKCRCPTRKVQMPTCFQHVFQRTAQISTGVQCPMSLIFLNPNPASHVCGAWITTTSCLNTYIKEQQICISMMSHHVWCWNQNPNPGFNCS